MKRILTLCGLVLLAGAGAFVYALTRPAHFGPPFAGAPSIGVGELLDQADVHLAADVRVAGRIVRQCPATGCWFYIEAPGGKQLRVELGHLGLTLPQKAGRVAVVEGRLVKNDTEFELVGNAVEFR